MTDETLKLMRNINADLALGYEPNYGNYNTGNKRRASWLQKKGYIVIGLNGAITATELGESQGC